MRPHPPQSLLRRFFGHLGGVAFVLGVLIVTFTFTYFATGLLFAWLGWQLNGWTLQITNTLVGLFILGCLISLVGRYFGRAQQMAVWRPILQALEQIARGDFSARVPARPRDQGIFTELIDSVNTVAAELDQMEQLRQAFISNVSHEIQSPLTSIRGFAQALQNDTLAPATRHHYLSIIEAESLRLSKLSESLLALAALDADQVKFAPRPYRLDKQLRTLSLTTEPQWAAKQLDLELDLPELTVTADEDLLSQVWLNLLHNSIKFTPAGGRITVRGRQADGQVSVSVADTGPGIAPADLPHVFERFYKADQARSATLNGAPGGSGLGLAIAREIVTRHQGTLTAASQPPAGAEFTVTLPITPPPALPAPP
jgi:signal transduction histidine kinase